MGATTTSDVLPALDAWTEQAAPLRQAADQLRRLALDGQSPNRREHLDESELGRALLAGYPDRVARRREAGSPRLLLATGAGAELARDSGSRRRMAVALDVAGAAMGGDARVFAASAIDREWLEPTQTTVEHSLTDDGRVRATRVAWYDALRLAETPTTPDPSAAAALLAKPISRGHTTSRRRSCCDDCVSSAPTSTCRRSSPGGTGMRSVDAIDSRRICPGTFGPLEREAPERLEVQADARPRSTIVTTAASPRR